MRTRIFRKTTALSSEKQYSRLRGWLLWIILSLMTGLIFLYTRHPAGKAVFFFVLFLPFVSLLCFTAVGKNLSAAFSLPENISKHVPVTCRLILQNKGIFACPSAAVRISVRNELTGESAEQTVPASAPSRGSTTVSFDFSSGHCGMLQFRVTDLYLYDWFGMFRIRRDLHAHGSVLILPETFPCELLVTLPYSEQGDEENRDPLRGTEDPSETFGLREYQPGDPVKRIHWKLTAKRGSPVIREISRPVSQTLLLFWKKTPGMPAEAADALAEAFSSAILSLSGRQIPFMIGWEDKDGPHMEASGEENSLLHAVSLAVRSGDVPEIPFRLPEEPGADRFAKVLWFSCVYPFEEEPFLPEESTVFLCSPETPPVGERYTVCFTPEETQDIFRTIQV